VSRGLASNSKGEVRVNDIHHRRHHLAMGKVSPDPGMCVTYTPGYCWIEWMKMKIVSNALGISELFGKREMVDHMEKRTVILT
jgi:hypothetical protein